MNYRHHTSRSVGSSVIGSSGDFLRSAVLRLVVVYSMLLGIFYFASSASAEEFRIAIVDLQRALGESKAGKSAQKEYEVEVKSAQAKLDKKKGEFEALKKNLEKQRESLNEQALLSKEEELIALEKDIKRSFRDAQEMLRRKNATIVSDLVKEIRKVVEGLGRKEGYSLILEKNAQAVMYSDASFDITDKVVQQFDASSISKK